MNCSQIQEMLSAYIDDFLDDFEKAEVEKHIQTCAICQQELIDLRHTVSLLRSLGEVCIPEDFHKQLMERIDKGPPADMVNKHKAVKPRYMKSGIWMQIAAAVLIMGIGVGAWAYSENGPLHSYGISSAPREKFQERVALKEKSISTAEQNKPTDSSGGGITSDTARTDENIRMEDQSNYLMEGKNGQEQGDSNVENDNVGQPLPNQVAEPAEVLLGRAAPASRKVQDKVMPGQQSAGQVEPSQTNPGPDLGEDIAQPFAAADLPDGSKSREQADVVDPENVSSPPLVSALKAPAATGEVEEGIPEIASQEQVELNSETTRDEITASQSGEAGKNEVLNEGSTGSIEKRTELVEPDVIPDSVSQKVEKSDIQAATADKSAAPMSEAGSDSVKSQGSSVRSQSKWLIPSVLAILLLFLAEVAFKHFRKRQ